MNRFLLLTAALFLGLAALALPTAWADPKAYTTEEFLYSADSVLNGNYQRILREHADQPAFIAKFKASQRAWLQFRNAEMAALFPHDKMDLAHGEGLTEAQQQWLTKLTEERSIQLVRWLSCMEEEGISDWTPCPDRHGKE
ncbi:MAG: lysozyme inhibitor LprI family protein [bacterium]|nr:lysozyme inhibitor LprI family protein [bacterium]